MVPGGEREREREREREGGRERERRGEGESEHVLPQYAETKGGGTMDQLI